MVQAPVQSPNHAAQVDQSSGSLGTGQLTVFMPNGQPSLTLGAIQALILAAQNTIVANTRAEIAAAKADLQNYIKHELADLETRVIAAESLKRIPIQLSNARIPFNSRLQYPAGVEIVEGMPTLKRDVFNLLESDCIITAEVLELPPLQGEPTLNQRRVQIGEFLGTV
ncbi:hypothetical protein H2248_005723 [Termitomyces sp. 'cryptogamus']|nr:hypothetical protein H2248_005723 [Termitomyces sp. 'cryptogamus']